ncbi:MAG: hypothetical protein ABL901_03080 [Hyphomicrobiaceae bacterium]
MFTSGLTAANDYGFRASGNFGLSTGGGLTPNFVVSTAGNVGIGTSAPAYKLQITGGDMYLDGNQFIRSTNSNNIRIGDYPQFYVNDTLLIRGGNQSITFGGTGAYATIASNVPWDFMSGTTAQGLRVYNTYTNATNYERAIFNWYGTSNVLKIGTEAAGTGTVRNIALVGGNVGIGTTAPAEVLEVAGNIKASGTLQVADTSGACSVAADVGKFRYNSASGKFQVCK